MRGASRWSAGTPARPGCDAEPTDGARPIGRSSAAFHATGAPDVADHDGAGLAQRVEGDHVADQVGWV
jgi:hypothetical protein